MQGFERQNERDGQGLSPLPLVRLALIAPFIRALDERRLDADAVLTENGLARETVLDPEVFVPVIVVHRFLESAAEAANDPHFGVSVGESMDVTRWTPLVDAVVHSETLVEFLLRLIRAVKAESSSARHTLEVGADYAFYREVRTTNQVIAPAQNDAFMAAFMLKLLRKAADPSWKAEEVLLKVCDPNVIPSAYMGIKVVGGDRMGMAIRFPSQWLLRPLDQRALIDASKLDELSHTPTEFLDSLRQTITLNLEKRELNVAFVARLAGISRQTLQRRLKANDTTFSAEVIELKKCHASEYLTSSAKPISEIATSLGFSDPTSFTRAFKSWTGMSPRQYRKGSQAL